MSLNESYKVLKELMDEHNKQKRDWLRNVLLLASTLFGVLISLHDKTLNTPNSPLYFALAIALLGCGILLSGTALYSHIDVLQRARKIYAEEAARAYRENRNAEPVSIYERKTFRFCEALSYICYAGCVILLVVHLFS